MKEREVNDGGSGASNRDEPRGTPSAGGQEVPSTGAGGTPSAGSRQTKQEGPVNRADGVLPKVAAEDDPKVWGDGAAENYDDWLKEQKPPHWG